MAHRQTMQAGIAFALFGFLAGFAYLAWIKHRELVAFGVGLVGVSFFLQGMQELIRGNEGVGALLTMLDLLRNVSLGGGAAFLAYVIGAEGWKHYRTWKERRQEEDRAFRLRLEGKEAAGSRPASSR